MSSSEVLHRSQQLSRIFQSEVCHLLDLGAGRTQSCRNHLDALSWHVAPTASIDIIAKCLPIFLCENYRNDSENIPSTYSPLSLPVLRNVLVSMAQVKKKNKKREKNMLRSLKFTVSVQLVKIVSIICY